MGKLFYGTQSGMSQSVAEQIQMALSEWIDEIVDISFAKPGEIAEEEFLVLGGGTYGSGELTTDWERFWPQMDKIDFTGKKVALFCLGDAWAYEDNFCSAMRIFYNKVIELGGEIIGRGAAASEYNFDHSEAVIDGFFVGAALDEMNESSKTPRRIAIWSMTVREQLVGIAI
ncbi:MAG: flavodoxin [Proteobacteria bacterium]|nr:MAG: flavodoxin [Pseudomonadota bacterium]